MKVFFLEELSSFEATFFYREDIERNLRFERTKVLFEKNF